MMDNGVITNNYEYGDGYMEQEEEWEREGLLDPAWEKQQKKVSLKTTYTQWFEVNIRLNENISCINFNILVTISLSRLWLIFLVFMFITLCLPEILINTPMIINDYRYKIYFKNQLALLIVLITISDYESIFRWRLL